MESTLHRALVGLDGRRLAHRAPHTSPDGCQAPLAAVGVHYQPPAWNILLPLGISFYTFHSMAYVLDVYWKRVEPIPKLADYALFIAFFTQLVAGPILRNADLVTQFARQ